MKDVVGALEVIAQLSCDHRELALVAALEQRVARVRGQCAEHVGAQHRHDHRPVAT